MSSPKRPVDNSRGPAPGRLVGWQEQRLFDPPVFTRERSSRAERLLALRSALRELHGGTASRHEEKTVDEFEKFLDWLIQNVRNY